MWSFFDKVRSWFGTLFDQTKTRANTPFPIEKSDSVASISSSDAVFDTSSISDLGTLSLRKGRDTVTAHVMDITTFEGGAIVNAANEQLSAGGGVCGAIFRASNAENLQDACYSYPVISGSDVRCVTGDAKITPSFGLECPWIIHAVGPKWVDGNSHEPELLESTYLRSLEVAHANGIRSIAFPAISTGIYKFPLELATAIAVKTIYAYVDRYPEHFDHIEFTCFNADILAVYEKHMQNAQFIESPEIASNTP